MHSSSLTELKDTCLLAKIRCILLALLLPLRVIYAILNDHADAKLIFIISVFNKCKFKK